MHTPALCLATRTIIRQLLQFAAASGPWAKKILQAKAMFGPNMHETFLPCSAFCDVHIMFIILFPVVLCQKQGYSGHVLIRSAAL